MNFLKTACIVTMCLLFAGMMFGNAQAQNWQLVWSDEFDGDSLNTDYWEYQIGTGTSEGLTNWGNNESQYYTDREENVYVEDGRLHIRALDEIFGNRNFTSARIRTKDKKDFLYGRFEIRAKMPIGQGIWPAIWMMPTDDVYGGWAASGEIDIMEYLGHQPHRVHGTLHYGGGWPNNVHSGTNYDLTSGRFSDDFYTFALEWEEGEMRWYVDDEHYQTQNDWFTTGHPFPAPFDKRFHFIFNVAVGGNWPGYPDHTTEFPQEMVVEYIRVYEDAEPTSANQDLLALPASIELQQNYPNPFNPTTNITFALPESAHVTLGVYNMLGQRVAVLTDNYLASGRHEVTFDGSHLSSGTYIYRLQAGDQVLTRSLTLVK